MVENENIEKVDELKDINKIVEIKKRELYRLRFLNRMSSLSSPLQIREKRKEIARLLTSKKMSCI